MDSYMSRPEDKKLTSIIVLVGIVVVVATMTYLKPTQSQIIEALEMSLFGSSLIYYFYSQLKPWDSVFAFNQYAQGWLSFFVGNIVGRAILEHYNLMEQPMFGLLLLTVFMVVSLGFFAYLFDFIYVKIGSKPTHH